MKEHQAGLGAKELCRKHCVSDAAFYKWRSKFSGVEVPDVKKQKSLEAENAKPKKLLAEKMMDVSTLKGMLEKLLRPGSRRIAVTWAVTEKRNNQKRDYPLAGIDPRVYRRTSKRPADTELRDRLRALSSERWRFGYRRLHILLKREGWHVN